MKKILSLLMLLVAIVTGVKAADYTNPATKTYGGFTFLDVAGTDKNVTANSKDYLTYGAYYIAVTKSVTTWYNCSDGSPASNKENGVVGDFSNKGFIKVTATTQDNTNGNGGLKLNSSRIRYYYVTGTNSVAGLVKDNGSAKYTQIQIQEVNNDGTLGEATTIDGNKSTSQYVIDGGALDPSKYYKISFTSNNTSNCVIYQVRFGKVSGPSITAQPQGASYVSGATMDALTVEATASAGTLAYQWYSCDDANRTNAQPIENETNASYTPTAAGFYYVNVKDGNGNIDSDVAQITVSEAEAPTISVSGTPAEAVKVGTEVTLTATATGVPTPTITWYNSSDEPVATEESTELAYTVPTTTAGTYTFYAKASNGVGDDATSAVQTVVVKEQVAKPTITPASRKFTESVTMTASSTTEEASYVYSVDGGATWNTLPNEGVVFTATTTAQVKATKTDYIDSEVATATYTLYTPTELVTISEATTWDFANLTGGKQFSGADLNTEFVYTDVDGVSVASGKTFNTDAIAFRGEYPLRSGQAASQNGTLRFNTSVAGTITVTFSDTGSSGSNPPKRYLNVNGVNTEFYTQRTGSKNDKKTSEAIAVPAGDVTITGMDEDGTTARAIMVYKVVFTPFAAQNITVGATGFATVGLPFATTVPAGVTAYAVESVNDSKVKMSAAIPTGTTIPANKGFVIVAAPNTYSFAPVASSSYEGTDILEATGINEKAATTDAPIYVLTVTDATNKKIGFKKATSGSLGAYKAYLPGTVSNSNSLSVSFDEETAINGIAESEANAEAPVKVIKNGKLFIGNYNVAGQQVK